MSTIQNLINSVVEEEHSEYLVKECSQEWASQNVHPLLNAYGVKNDVGVIVPTLFSAHTLWTITFPSKGFSIPNRGKRTDYYKCNTGVQFHYLKYCLLTKDWNTFENSFISIEHSKVGSLHVHILCPEMGQREQNRRAEIMQNFGLDYKGFDHILNINVRKVDNLFKAEAYFLKDPIQWVSQKDECIDKFNESIIRKQYEKSKYNFFYIKRIF